MDNEIIFNNEIFDENKPNFNFLKNLNAEKKLKDIYRLKKFSSEDQDYFSADFSLSLTNDSEFIHKSIDTYFENENLFINTHVNTIKKTVKIFKLNLFEKELKNISLLKEFNLNKTTSCIEISDQNVKYSKFRKNFTAIGTYFNGISIWNTDKIMEDEPLCILKGKHYEITKKPTGIKKSIINQSSEQQGAFVSSLKWNLDSENYILEGSSNGWLNYWDIPKGETVFKFFVNSLPISSLNWRNCNKNEFMCLSGNYVSCFVDIRDPEKTHKIFFQKKVKGIDWLKCENLYTVVEESGLVYLKDIRFQRGTIYSNNIYQNKKSSKIEYFQFSQSKKNLMVIDKHKKIHTFFFNGLEFLNTSSDKIINPLTKDFIWLKSRNSESLALIENNSKFLFMKN